MSGAAPQKKEIRISDVTLSKHQDYQELSATLDGEHVWFRFPLDIDIKARPEIFIPFCIFEAMLQGCPIVVDPEYPVSEKILAHFEEIQNIYCSWNSDLSKVQLVASTEKTSNTSDDVYCCYSGGIDSTYTYAKYRDQITHLILIKGFDNFRDEDGWQQNIRNRQEFADKEGKKLVPVDNNGRAFLENRWIPFIPVHGAILCCTAVTLGAERLYIPSTFPYNAMFPWGSHPLLDILWSTESTQIIHDGLEATRSQKTEYVAQSQELLDQLQVCWRSSGSNCGNCPKCVRTSVALDVLGKHSANLPAFKTHADINYLKPTSEGTLPFTEDLIYFAHRHNAVDLEKALKKLRRNYIVKNALTNLVKAITGGWGWKLHRMFNKKGAWERYRTGHRPLKSNLQ